MQTLFRVEGKMSTFGGPDDDGMQPNEGLALFASEQDMKNHGLADYLLPEADAGAPGLGRRLNPDKFYFACRWWETSLKSEFLRSASAWVTNSKTGARVQARPVDSGPNASTHRVADLSPGLARKLRLNTDDVCTVTITDEGAEFGTSFDHNAAPTANAGPRIFTTSEWGAAPAKVSYFPRAAALGIVIHNTDGANRAPFADPAVEQAAAFANARQIQADHFTRGWSDTGQHFTVSQGGVITEGRHWTLDAAKSGLVVRGAHAPSANDNWWGIEIAGRNVSAYVVTSEQWEAVVQLCAWLSTLAGKKLDIQPHKHFTNTDCPGMIVDHLDALRNDVEQRSGL